MADQAMPVESPRDRRFKPVVFRRFLAFALDELLVYISLGFILYGTRTFGSEVFWDAYFQPVLTFGLTLIYFTLTEGRAGQSPFKRVFRLRLSREDGRTPRYAYVSMRTLGVLLFTEVGPALADERPVLGAVFFGMGVANLIFYFMNSERRTWVDFFTRSNVVSVGDESRVVWGPVPVKSWKFALAGAALFAGLSILSATLDRTEEPPPEFAPALRSALSLPVLSTDYVAVQEGVGPVRLTLPADLPLPDTVPANTSAEDLNAFREQLTPQANAVMRRMSEIYRGRAVDGFRVNFVGKRRLNFIFTDVKLSFDAVNEGGSVPSKRD